MIPIRDENPALHTSMATFGLIALNIVSWIVIQKMGTFPGLFESICRFGLIPGELLGTVKPGTHIRLAQRIVCRTGEPAWWTLFTSMFMHGGWFHIIGNMWFMFIFGDNVEDVMGSAKFVLFYLVCGTAAAGAQILADPSSAVPMVGASGAIGGVMGAYIVMFPKAPVHMLVFFFFIFFRIAVPAFVMLGYWFFLQLAGGMVSFSEGTGGVAFWAHIGGFAAGALLVHLFTDRERVREIRERRGRARRIVYRYR